MDKSITQLTALTTADQADVYPIVDVSVGETKKITQNNLEDTIANSSNFVDGLVANSYFIDEVGTTLASDTNFIDELTQNTTFQNSVNNFISGGGGGGLSTLTQTFTFSDFVDDGSGNGIATFTDDLPEDAVPVGVVYEITSAFDATSTLKVINSVAGGIVIGASVDATIANILTGQTDGDNTAFDFGATPNPVVYIAGVVPTQGAVTVTVLYSTSSGVSGGSKKVGVGEIGDVDWFNIQFPFHPDGDMSDDTWIYNGVVNNSSYCILTATDSVYSNDSGGTITSFLPNFDNTSGILRFNTTKQVIFQQLVLTNNGGANVFASGVGFEQLGNGGWADSQGDTTTEGVGFVRKDSDGQWYARACDGSANTENAVSISDGKHVLRVEYDPGNATPQARFYVDGVLVSTITTNLPTAFVGPIGFFSGNSTAGGSIGITLVAVPSFAVEI
jgi:hypothetical protein